MSPPTEPISQKEKTGARFVKRPASLQRRSCVAPLDRASAYDDRVFKDTSWQATCD
jgi:hypothetical protein